MDGAPSPPRSAPPRGAIIDPAQDARANMIVRRDFLFFGVTIGSAMVGLRVLTLVLYGY